MGKGKINFIDRLPTITKGKYNLIVQASFDIGQNGLFSKLFNDTNIVTEHQTQSVDTDDLIPVATERLNPKILDKFKSYLSKQKKMHKAQIELLLTLLRNED